MFLLLTCGDLLFRVVGFFSYAPSIITKTRKWRQKEHQRWLQHNDEGEAPPGAEEPEQKSVNAVPEVEVRVLVHGAFTPLFLFSSGSLGDRLFSTGQPRGKAIRV